VVLPPEGLEPAVLPESGSELPGDTGLAVLCPYGGGELSDGGGTTLLLPYTGGATPEVETPGWLTPLLGIVAR
jgi:hypothetical protein